MAEKHLLIVFHSQSGGTTAMADAVIDGARDASIEGITVEVVDALAQADVMARMK